MDYSAPVPDHVMCPLVDTLIAAYECIETRDVVGGLIKAVVMPEEYRQKPNWEDVCRQCEWHEY